MKDAYGIKALVLRTPLTTTELLEIAEVAIQKSIKSIHENPQTPEKVHPAPISFDAKDEIPAEELPDS